MSSLNQLFTSFIKGIAKTTGTLTVLSVAAILWQLYTKENNFQSTIQPSESKGEPESKSEIKAEPKGEEADLECSFIDCNNNMENENITNQNMKKNFKKIFDRL